jgi:hypothetical protein
MEGQIVTKYMEGLFAGVGNTVKDTSATAWKTITEVDAREKTGLMAVCSFAGSEFDSEKKRRCTNFIQHSQKAEGVCSHFRTDIGVGGCDCGK